MDKVPWNRVIYQEFVSLAYLTPEEANILETRKLGLVTCGIRPTYPD